MREVEVRLLMCEALLYEVNGYGGKGKVTLVWAVGVDMIATSQEETKAPPSSQAGPKESIPQKRACV